MGGCAKLFRKAAYVIRSDVSDFLICLIIRHIEKHSLTKTSRITVKSTIEQVRRVTMQTNFGKMQRANTMPLVETGSNV